MQKNQTPLLLVISAPSGAGKSSLCNQLVQQFPLMIYSTSCTTRAPRGAEKDGVHYHFLSEEQFCRRIEAGDFVEHAMVHGNRYGTLKQTLYDAFADGRDVIMDIDVQGAAQIREACRNMDENDPIRKGFVDIFITAPSMEELRRRLCGRSTDADEVIEKRLRNAEEEMGQQGLYRHVIVNDNFKKAVDDLVEVICTEHELRA